MRILIIAEYMAPAQAIASIRWTKLGKYLAKDHGCQVDILTNKKIYEEQISGAELYAYDDTLCDDLKFFSNVYEIPGTFKGRFVIRALNAVKYYRKAKQRKKDSGSDARSGSTPVLGTSATAAKLGDAYLRLKESSYISSGLKMDIPWGDYDVIISTYGPKWTHLIAEEVKAIYPDIVWIADYRDFVIDAHSDINTVNNTFAKLHTGTADCIFTVAKDSVDQLFLPDGQKAVVIYNGFDSEEQRARKRMEIEKFVLAYTGTIYDNPPKAQDMTPIFEALSYLIEAGDIDFKDVLVAYCGASESVFLRQASQYPIVPIKNLGLKSRREAQSLQDCASLLIFLTWNTQDSGGVMTGKLYEYLASDTPIVSVCSGDVPDAEPSEVIRKAKAGFAYEQANRAADFPLLVEYIHQKYNEWKSCGMTIREADAAFVESFEHASIATHVYDIITKLNV